MTAASNSESRKRAAERLADSTPHADPTAAAVRAAQAEAWDEGRAFGARDRQGYEVGDGCGPDPHDCTCPNPYRADRLATDTAAPEGEAALEAMCDRLAERHVDLQEAVENGLREAVAWRDRMPRTRENHTYENGRQDGVDVAVRLVRSLVSAHLRGEDRHDTAAPVAVEGVETVETLAEHRGLHSCVGCGVELDGDDPNDRCDECPADPADSLADVLAAYERAHDELDRMTSAPGGPGASWRWSIPANPERDSDLILSDALRHIPDLAARIVQARAGEGALRERIEALLADEWSDEPPSPTYPEGRRLYRWPADLRDDLRAALDPEATT